jgi:hypothetical protein
LDFFCCSQRAEHEWHIFCHFAEGFVEAFGVFGGIEYLLRGFDD